MVDNNGVAETSDEIEKPNLFGVWRTELMNHKCCSAKNTDNSLGAKSVFDIEIRTFRKYCCCGLGTESSKNSL